MNNSGAKLCSYFSRQPNFLGYCGRESAKDAFRKCLLTGKCNDIPDEVSQFIVLNPYLETIAQITGLPKLSHEVVECFWLGNDLLKLCRPEHYTILLKNLERQGVPSFLIEEVRSKVPQTFIPIHLFNIMHIGVGKASGSVPFNLESINHCMIRWGTVTNIKEGIATINAVELSSDAKIETTTLDLPYDTFLFPTLKIEDTVAIHWGSIAKKLETKELENLTYWTDQFLANERSFFLEA